MIDLNKIQEEMREWQRHNFPLRKSHIPAMGMGEEIGELATVTEDDNPHIIELSRALGKFYHAHIKLEQGIRKNENHHHAKMDAIADILIYLIDYCNDHGFNIEQIINYTWGQVKQRDWVKYPTTGKPPVGSVEVNQDSAPICPVCKEEIDMGGFCACHGCS